MQVLVGCSFTFFKYLLHPKSVLVRRRKQKQWQTSSEPIRTKRLVGPLFLTKNIGDFFFLKWYDMAKKWSDHGINKTTRNTVKESINLQSTWKIQFHRLSSCNLFDHLISTPNVCWQPIRKNWKWNSQNGKCLFDERLYLWASWTSLPRPTIATIPSVLVEEPPARSSTPFKGPPPFTVSASPFTVTASSLWVNWSGILSNLFWDVERRKVTVI